MNRSIRLISAFTMMLVLTLGLVSVASAAMYTFDFSNLGEGATAISQTVGGVTLNVTGSSNDGDPAMIFDANCGGGPAANCSGGDPDLYQPGQGSVVIISEDGDSSDPDDDTDGGHLYFSFSAPVNVISLKALDVDQVDGGGSFVNSSAGNVAIPAGADGNIQTIMLNFMNVTSFHVYFSGSGAIDDIVIEIPDEEPECPEGEWCKSSLQFVGSTTVSNGTVSTTLCNYGDGDMSGSSTWELWYAARGNPKFGSMIASGSFGPLDSGECTTLATSTQGLSGNFKFAAYQETGHPGQPKIWSN